MKHVSLFSGIGGIDLAAEWAGFRTILFCESDPYCKKVLSKHWPSVPIIDDIRHVTKDLVNDTVDVVSGGFPCQPFSLFGKRKSTEDDRYIWPEMFRIVREIKPTFVVAENVPGLLAIDEGLVLEQTLSDLESEGYETITLVYPACGIDAVHKRERIFIVAHTNCNRWHNVEDDEKERCTDCYSEMFKPWEIISSDLYLLMEQMEHQPISGIRRNDDGVSKGMDRLRALGNAVMPQQAYPIFKSIAVMIGGEHVNAKVY